MNTKDFLRLGVPLGEATRRATDFEFILGGGDTSRLREEVAAIVASPAAFVGDPWRGEFAQTMLHAPPPPRAVTFKAAATGGVVRKTWTVPLTFAGSPTRRPQTLFRDQRPSP